MADADIAVIGLGTLGAPLFQELVKVRTQRLRILDSDHVDPGTSVRYPLGLKQAGLDKTLALAQWAYEHNPEVEVVQGIVRLGALNPDAPTSEGQILHEIVAGTDLMVSATAEHDVNRYLDQYARDLNVTRLFLWSQSGYGGVVALLQRGKTACFSCLEHRLSHEADIGGHFVDVPPDTPEGLPAGTLQARGCGDKTFSAIHPDLLPLTSQAARVAMGHISGPQGGYPAFEDDVFVVQMRDAATGQPIPPRWTSLTLPPNDGCPQCAG